MRGTGPSFGSLASLRLVVALHLEGGVAVLGDGVDRGTSVVRIAARGQKEGGDQDQEEPGAVPAVLPRDAHVGSGLAHGGAHGGGQGHPRRAQGAHERGLLIAVVSVAVVSVWWFLFSKDGMVNQLLGSLAPDPSWLINSTLAMPLIAVGFTLNPSTRLGR